MAPTLTRSDLMALRELVDAGGGATVSPNGQLVREALKNTHGLVTAPAIHLQGAPATWMRLIVLGFVGGEGGKLIATESGREVARQNSILHINQ